MNECIDSIVVKFDTKQDIFKKNKMFYFKKQFKKYRFMLCHIN